MGFIDVNINKDSEDSAVNMIKILNWLIPFVLGLVSAFVIDIIKQRLRRKKIKKFTVNHLKNGVLPQLKIMKSEFGILEDHVKNLRTQRLVSNVFENLNTDSLQACSQSEYYEIFEDDFETFNEIKSTISFLTKNIPFKLSEEYYTTVNAHLKEQGQSANMQHVKECRFCIDCKDFVIKTADLRIKELDELEAKITRITK